MKKKIIITLLSLTLVLTFMPMSAFAEQSQSDIDAAVAKGASEFQDMSKEQISNFSIPIGVFASLLRLNASEANSDLSGDVTISELTEYMTKENLDKLVQSLPENTVKDTNELAGIIGYGFIPLITECGEPFQIDYTNFILSTYGSDKLCLAEMQAFFGSAPSAGEYDASNSNVKKTHSIPAIQPCIVVADSVSVAYDVNNPAPTSKIELSRQSLAGLTASASNGLGSTSSDSKNSSIMNTTIKSIYFLGPVDNIKGIENLVSATNDTSTIHIDESSEAAISKIQSKAMDIREKEDFRVSKAKVVKNIPEIKEQISNFSTPNTFIIWIFAGVFVVAGIIALTLVNLKKQGKKIDFKSFIKK